MKPISTINVLAFLKENDASSLHRMASFPDDSGGNTAAESIFIDWINEALKEAGQETLDDQTSEDLLNNDSYYEAGGQFFTIFHSTEPAEKPS